MKPVSNIYIDDCLYQDQINLYDVNLMAGREHVLRVRSYPEQELDDMSATFQGPGRLVQDKGVLRLFLPELSEAVEGKLILQSPTGGFKESYRLHLFPAFDYSKRVGTYVNQRNKRQSIRLEKDGTVIIETDDLVDSLPPFRLEAKGMDSLSLKLLLPAGEYEGEEETQFVLTPNILFSSREKALLAAFHLEAYQDGMSDSCYLCGEGDEDGIIAYDTFVFMEQQ